MPSDRLTTHLLEVDCPPSLRDRGWVQGLAGPRDERDSLDPWERSFSPLFFAWASEGWTLRLAVGLGYRAEQVEREPAGAEQLPHEVQRMKAPTRDY